MDKLLFDLHDIFADNFGLYPSDIGIVSLFVFGGMLSFLSFILSIYIFIKIIQKIKMISLIMFILTIGRRKPDILSIY